MTPLGPVAPVAPAAPSHLRPLGGSAREVDRDAAASALLVVDEDTGVLSNDGD